jgi:hypothetical protein
MCTDDGDPCVVWSEARVNAARKPWKCYECDLPIPVGAPYIRITAIQERGDRPQTYQQHVGCSALADFIRDDICGAHGEHGYIELGGLDNEISNLNEYGTATLAERDDLLALGFDFTLDDDGEPDDAPGAREVCLWLWNIVRAEYRPTAVTR